MLATVDKLPEQDKLYIGEGVTINGAVQTSGTVVVEGVLEGDISVNNLLVGETGTVKGRISVTENAEIFGQVFERLNVNGLLILRASCRVDGHVSCGALQIEQGASVRGAFHPTDYRADQTFTSPRRDASARQDVSRPANGTTSTLSRFDLPGLGQAGRLPAIT
jgi:cytoskeletal protein CcmA (bactofilin family)